MYYNYFSPMVLGSLLIFLHSSPTSIIPPKGMTHPHIFYLQNEFSGNNFCCLQQYMPNIHSQRGQNMGSLFLRSDRGCLGGARSLKFPSLKWPLFSWIYC